MRGDDHAIFGLRIYASDDVVNGYFLAVFGCFSFAGLEIGGVAGVLEFLKKPIRTFFMGSGARNTKAKGQLFFYILIGIVGRKS